MKLQTIQEKASRTLWAASTLFIIGLTMTSCAENDENAAAVGYLCPPAFEVDVTVENLDQTRSVTIERPSDLETKTYFIVKDANGIVKHEGEGLWTEPLVLPVGSYTIEGKYGENGFGAPYLMGQCEGEIVALGQETPEITLTLQNAMAKVSVSADMLVHFTPNATATFTSEGTPHTVGYNTYEFIPAGEDKKLEISLPGTNSAGNDATFTYTLTNPASGTAYDVVCGADTENWPSITLYASYFEAWEGILFTNTPKSAFENISAENQAKVVYEVSESKDDWSNALSSECFVGNDGKNYFVVKGLTKTSDYYVRASVGKIVSDIVGPITVSKGVKADEPVKIEHKDDQMLTGTSATLDLDFSEILKQYVDAGVLLLNTTLSKSGISTPVRSSTSYYADIMDVTPGWPYLPQGSDYTLNVGYRLKNETTKTPVMTKTLSVEKPENIKFTYTAQCSYDMYQLGTTESIAAANKCDAETIYITASWNISDDILTNSNYSKSFTVTLDGGTPQNMTIDANEKDYTVSGEDRELSWASHTALYSASFDGISLCDETQTHHITGIPYTAAPPTANDWTPTTSGDVSWIGVDRKSYVDFTTSHVKLMPRSGNDAKIHFNGFYIPSGHTVKTHLHNEMQKDCLGGTTVNYSLTFGGESVSKGAYESDTYMFDVYPAISGNSSITINTSYSDWHSSSYYIYVKKVEVKYSE